MPALPTRRSRLIRSKQPDFGKAVLVDDRTVLIPGELVGADEEIVYGRFYGDDVHILGFYRGSSLNWTYGSVAELTKERSNLEIGIRPLTSKVPQPAIERTCEIIHGYLLAKGLDVHRVQYSPPPA